MLIPADLEEQKILATGVYGTNLVKVRGNYDDVNRLCTELSGDRENWAFVNVNMRPYYAEGSKTLAYEIAEQLGWELPDRSSCRSPRARCTRRSPRASRSGSTSGLIDGERADDERRPGRGLLAGRAARSTPGNDVCRPVKPDTIAKSLAIGNPADGPYALDLARATRRRRSTPSPTTRSAPASACSPRRPASSPRRPAA